MKKAIITLLAISPLCMQGQTDGDSIKQGGGANMEVKIGVNELSLLQNDSKKLVELKRQYESLRKKSVADTQKIAALTRKSDSLSYINKKMERQYSSLRDTLISSDKTLLRVASNFLYIPYEAFGIEEIAMSAYNAVNDKELLRKHGIRGVLLKNYKNDIVAFMKFLRDIPDALKNPFDREASTALINKLHGEYYYTNYLKYDDWKNTYLGGMLLEIENRLRAHDGPDKKKVETKDLIEKLEKCLESIKEI